MGPVEGLEPRSAIGMPWARDLGGVDG